MKYIKKFLITSLLAILLPLSSAQALIPLQVNQGGTGVNTITGLIRGNGINPFSVAIPGTDYATNLASVSAFSTTATTSTYTMTSGVPVNFKTSDTNSLLYLDDTNKTVGIRKTSSLLALSVQGTNAGASSSGSSENGAIRVLGAGTNAILDIGIVGSGAHSWLQVRDSSNYATTYNLALQPTGGGVMIGTVSRVGGNRLTVVNSSAPGAGFFASSSSVLNINSISDTTQIVLSTGAGAGSVRGYLGADSINAFHVYNSSASTQLLKVVNATGVLEVGTGFYANQSLMSIGATITGGYNGSYGIYNARGGLIDMNRFFVGENNNTGGISTMELRGLGSSAGTRTMGRFNVNSYAVAGNYTGTSLAIASTTHIDSSNTGYSGSASGTLVSTSGAKIDIIGTTSTNASMRLDSNGLRIDTSANIHTTNSASYRLDINGDTRTTGLILSTASSDGLMQIVSAGTTRSYMGADASNRFIVYDNTASNAYLKVANTGAITLANLAGTGTRMVTADSTGLLATDTLPVGTNYTPTATNVTNVSSSTPNNATYTRVGNVVNVDGSIDVTVTSAVATEVDVSLPIASNLANATDLNGQGYGLTTLGASLGVYVTGDTTNDRAQIKFTGLTVGGVQTIYYHFSYKVI